MKRRNIIFGVVLSIGAAVAAGFGIYALVKKHDANYWADSSDDEFEDLGGEEEVVINPESGGETVNASYGGGSSSEIKEKLLKNWDKPDLHEYAAGLKGDASSDSEDDFADEELSEEEEYEKRLEEEAFEADKRHRENRNKPPEIISEEDVVNDNFPDEFEVEELILWTLDNIVTNEDGDLIAGPEDLYGDVLEKVGFKLDDNKDDIYVINYGLDTIYHVTKFYKSFVGDTIADIAEESGYVENEEGNVG